MSVYSFNKTAGDPGKIIIVGAGVAGLALAYRLRLAEKNFLLVEKNSAVGGLAKSFNYDGYVFDIGPHRFYTDNQEVTDFVNDILNGDFLTIERKSGVWMFGKYFDWPFSISSFFNMPLPVILSAGIDLMKRHDNTGSSFEDYITGMYGETLYKIFFKPYTEKFLKTGCKTVSRDWAVTGIDRAVIDKKVRINTLFDLAKSVVSPQPPLKFIYPASGGINVFSESLKRRISAGNNDILFNASVSKIIAEGNEIKKVFINGRAYECDLLVWTAPVTGILQLLGYGPAELEYLSLILYNYRINGKHPVDYQWCYYGSADIPFNRISIPVLFNPALAPSGKAGICIEVTCKKGDPVWRSPDSIERGIREAMLTVGMIKDKKEVIGLNIERIADAYPIYSMNYRENLDRIMKFTGHFINLKLLGRTGTFWYNNMDNSIEAALKLYREI